MLSEFHPVSLGFEIAMHWRGPEARVAPKTRGPPEQTSKHQYERNGDPLRESALGRPEEGHERECGLAGVCSVVEIESAMGNVRERALLNLPPTASLVRLG